MIAYELLAKRASPKAMTEIPLWMLMPNGYMYTDIPSLFTEIRYTKDVFDRISVTAKDTVISLYGYPNQLTRGFPTAPEIETNSDMYTRTCHAQFKGFRVSTHCFPTKPDKESYVVHEYIGSRRVVELNRELENAIQEHSLALTVEMAGYL